MEKCPKCGADLNEEGKCACGCGTDGMCCTCVGEETPKEDDSMVDLDATEGTEE